MYVYFKFSRDTPLRINQIYGVFTGDKGIERNQLAIGCPAWCPSNADPKRCQLDGIGTVGVADPYFIGTGPVGFKGDFAAIWGNIRCLLFAR